MLEFFLNKLELDDIVFENRNKDYGAYPIRKNYNINLIISIVLASLIVIAAVIIPYLDYIGKSHKAGKEIRLRYVEMKMEKMEPPREDIYIPPAPAPPPPNTLANIKYVAPVVVDSVLPEEKSQPTVDDVRASNPDSDQKLVPGSGNSDDLLTGQDGEKSDEPYVIVEVPPTFKGGGIEKFRDWVQKRTVYPQIAQDNGIQGKVAVSFVIERDGSVSNVKIVRKVNPLLDAEAIKAIESSPQWSPGLQRGRPVRVRFVIPLVFAFNK
jgi:periplasmic protein TonB